MTRAISARAGLPNVEASPFKAWQLRERLATSPASALLTALRARRIGADCAAELEPRALAVAQELRAAGI